MKKSKLYLPIILLIVILTTFSNYLIYNSYYNQKILDITNQLIETNENINPNDIATILKNPSPSSSNLLEEYGYDINDFYLLGDMEQIVLTNISINTIITLIILTIIYLLFSKKEKIRKNEIQELVDYLEIINSGNYDIHVDKYNESELSKLRNTIYKTTVLLKEHTEYLQNDRIALKDNLADVSHQLKTPLTSIGLMLESIMEDKDMPQEKREEFITKIYERNEKINYLVEVLLKLSKLDASVITFKKEAVSLEEMLQGITYSLESLSSKKNVSIHIEGCKNIILTCDRKWQEEAITNIIKNCIDFSSENGTIHIQGMDNNFYTLLTIEDHGCGIKEAEISKVFKRFHKSENSKGFGIGLNLSKTIIEKDNGTIKVESKENEYTKFIIKYIKA